MASVFDYIFNIGGNFSQQMRGMIDSTGQLTASIDGTRDRVSGLASALDSFDYAKNIAQSLADGVASLSASPSARTFRPSRQ